MKIQVCGKTYNIRAPIRRGDVGYDLCSDEYAVIMPLSRRYLKTGVRVKLPDGYWARIAGRSSTMREKHLMTIEGIIDNGYTGELLVGVLNLGGQKVIVKQGERLAQLILHPIVVPALEDVDSLPGTDRGGQGFGSTGT